MARYLKEFVYKDMEGYRLYSEHQFIA